MFKRKCHKFGEAIWKIGEITHFCTCISPGEVWDVWKDGHDNALKEKQNV
jgi:hypothetical protein